MRRHRLSLTGVGSQLTENAEKKIEESEEYQIPRCSNGLTEEQYLDLNINLPEDLIKKIKNQERGVELKDEDYEETTSEIVVFTDQIKLITTDNDFTTIFLKDNLTITVTETADEIDFYLELLERSWFTKQKDMFSMVFSKIFKIKLGK